jgi:hypothetical protein
MALYLVKQGDTERLIDATNKVAAIRHYVTPLVSAEVAEPGDIHRLAKAGVEIEVAGAAASEEN